MTRKAKITLSLSGVLVLCLITLAFAAPPGAFSGCGHGPFGRERIKDHILDKMDDKIEALNLTTDQQVAYRKVRMKISEEIDAVRADHEKMRGKMHSLLQNKTPDFDAMAALIKNRLDTTPKAVAKNIDLIVAFTHTLDDAQKTRLMEMFKECRQDGHGFGDS